MKKLYAVIQQGGSTHEFYASTYNTPRQAERAKRGHERASYNAIGPFEFEVIQADGGVFIAEDHLIELLESVAKAAVDL